MDWISQLRSDGYAMLPDRIPPCLLDQHRSVAAELFAAFDCGHNRGAQHLPPGQQNALSTEMNKLMYGQDGGARPLAFAPEIQDRMHTLFGAEPLLASARTTLWEAGDRAAHFDTSMVSTAPHEHVCRTWCALEDIDPDCGIFYVYPGTHASVPDAVCREALEKPGVRDGLHALQEAYSRCGRSVAAVTVEPAWKHFHALAWPVICELVEQKTRYMERKTFPLRKGQVVVFSTRVVHGTMPRTDPSLPRPCQISEWRAASARVFFAADSFGPTHDLRGTPDAGWPASRDALRTPWGLLGAQN